jgi:hypothetical protein
MGLSTKAGTHIGIGFAQGIITQAPSNEDPTKPILVSQSQHSQHPEDMFGWLDLQDLLKENQYKRPAIPEKIG